MKYVIGILAIVIGAHMVIKTETYVQSFGMSSWAESHMGTSGGTRLLYKLIGIAMIFVAMLAMTGMLGGILIGVFGRLFGL